ncbi:MAG TPA: hypothetical protein VK588_16045 [Chitinophagaceae bacterium]|nr:hypothetical protein [Chitinophagaceae bacterium]
MKKILFLGFILTLFAVSASAQSDDGGRFRHHREVRSYHHGELNRFEKRRLHHDRFHYGMARRRVHRDRFVSHSERRHLDNIRRHDRRESYRFNHNNRRRLI